MASRAARRFWVRAVLSTGVYHSLSFSLGFAVSFDSVGEFLQRKS
jgi:hypothetical protein